MLQRVDLEAGDEGLPVEALQGAKLPERAAVAHKEVVDNFVDRPAAWRGPDRRRLGRDLVEQALDAAKGASRDERTAPADASAPLRRR